MACVPCQITAVFLSQDALNLWGGHPSWVAPPPHTMGGLGAKGHRAAALRAVDALGAALVVEVELLERRNSKYRFAVDELALDAAATHV